MFCHGVLVDGLSVGRICVIFILCLSVNYDLHSGLFNDKKCKFTKVAYDKNLIMSEWTWYQMHMYAHDIECDKNYLQVWTRLEMKGSVNGFYGNDLT